MRPIDKYRLMSLGIAIAVLLAAFLGTPDWWNDY